MDGKTYSVLKVETERSLFPINQNQKYNYTPDEGAACIKLNLSFKCAAANGTTTNLQVTIASLHINTAWFIRAWICCSTSDWNETTPDLSSGCNTVVYVIHITITCKWSILLFDPPTTLWDNYLSVLCYDKLIIIFIIHYNGWVFHLLLNFVFLFSSVKKHFRKCTYERTCENAYELTIGPPELSKHISNTFRRYDCHC